MKNYSINLFLFLIVCIFTKDTLYSQVNNYIYFSSEKETAGRDIMRMDANGDNIIKLTNNNGANHYPHHINPKLSPDKTKLVFQSDTDQHDKYAIWTMQVDGSNKKRITQKEGLYPCWSPDGKNIVFSGRRNGIWEIIMIASNGGEERILSKNFKKKERPGWGAIITFNPNNKSIIYSYLREKVLYEMDLKTKQITQLTNESDRFTQPIFSKDGSKIAANRKTPNDEGYNLVTLSSDGKNVKVIAKSVISYSSPAWSDLGNEILFCGMINGNQQLFKINLDTRKESLLTKKSNFNAMPTW